MQINVAWLHSFVQEQLKHIEGVHCSVIEHRMTPLSFQTIQKNEAKLKWRHTVLYN